MTESKYEKVCSIWNSYDIKTKADLENQLDSFKVIFAYHSGKIENDEITYDDTREIFEKGKLNNFTGNVRTIFEIQNQKICYDFLIEKIIKKEPLSIELIKQIHKRLARGTYDDRRYHINKERPGEFKKHDYVTGPEEVGSYPEDVDEDMRYLLNEVNEFSAKEHALQAAAYLHACFENIYPFADANGRTGRTIMNYYLMIHDHPPVIIYDDEKKGYLKALREFDENDSLASLVVFLKQSTVRTWNRLLKERQPKLSTRTRPLERLEEGKGITDKDQ